MKRFKQYLLEGGRNYFGINPFDQGANKDIEDLARSLGYRVEGGASHVKVINPKTGQLVSSISRGAHRSTYSDDNALRNIVKDLEASGSKVKPSMTAKDVKREIRIQGKPPGSFPMASGPNPEIIATKIDPSIQGETSKLASATKTAKAIGGPMVATYLGTKLAEPVQTAGERTGLIDLIAKGINAVVPTDWLASGESPAEEQRRIEQENKDFMKMPSPFGGDILIPKNTKFSSKKFLENYDPYMDVTRYRPDGTLKGPGWQGAFKNKKGQDVSEYSISVPTEEIMDMDLPQGTHLYKPETLIPTIVPESDEEDLANIIRATETGEELPTKTVQKAYSHAQKRIRQGQSQFK